MITKEDCLALLVDLEDTCGEEVDDYIIKVTSSAQVPIEVLKYINSKRPFDVTQFYDHIRKNYNRKKSSLYINIVKEIEDDNEVLTTLGALQLQILLYGRKIEDKEQFYTHTRAEEISKVIYNYYKTGDITNCIKLIKLIKADIQLFELLNGRKKELEVA